MCYLILKTVRFFCRILYNQSYGVFYSSKCSAIIEMLISVSGHVCSHVTLSGNTMTKLHTFGPSQCVKLNSDTNVVPCHFTHTSRHPFISTPYIIIIIIVCQMKVAVQRPLSLCLLFDFKAQHSNLVTWTDTDPRHSCT